MTDKEFQDWIDKACKEVKEGNRKIANKQINEVKSGAIVQVEGSREDFTPPPGMIVYSMTVGGKTTNYLSKELNQSATAQNFKHFEPMTREQAIAYLDRENLDSSIVHSPFYTFVGNKEAVDTICAKLIMALIREDHCCTANFALYGPGGCGKTQLAKTIAQTLKLPFIRIDGKSEDIKTTSELFAEIVEVIEKHYGDSALQLQSGCAPEGVHVTTEDNTFHLPPCVVFIDESHALNRSLRENILTAIEKTDAQMRVAKVKGAEGSFIVYTDRVCWIMATTDKGKISSPLKTRFKSIQLNKYSVTELGELVALKFGYPPEVCLEIALYCRSSARLTNDFAADIKEEIEGLELEEMLKVVRINAEREGMTQIGLNRKQLEALDVLSNNDVLSQNDLANAINVGSEELIDDILPDLKVAGEDWPKMIAIGPRGLSLTEEGRIFLKDLK